MTVTGASLARRWDAMAAAGLIGPGAVRPDAEGFDRLAERLGPAITRPVPAEVAAKVRRILAGAHRRKAAP